jgi:hypothetical protein
VVAASAAGPWAYIVLGAVLLVVGTALASDFRGLGTRYIQIGRPAQEIPMKASEKLANRYRIRYGVAALVGLILIVSGAGHL